MTSELRSTSPTGRYILTVVPWEARMSLWVESPTLEDSITGKSLLQFKDPNWSLLSANWLSDSVVVLRLRKYPGDHVPHEVSATLDCSSHTASVGELHVARLEQLERVLDRMLKSTVQTKPGLLQRMFGRRA